LSLQGCSDEKSTYRLAKILQSGPQSDQPTENMKSQRPHSWVMFRVSLPLPAGSFEGRNLAILLQSKTGGRVTVRGLELMPISHCPGL
jgi:hypothetical protein